MSSLSATLNTAVNSMMANQLALSVASNNIANSNDPDYARQRLLMRPAGPSVWPFGIGMGVQVVGVDSIRDNLVEARYRSALSGQSDAQTMAGGLSDIESIFNDSNNTGLLKNINDFFHSFQDLSTDPASAALRTQVQVAAGSLIATMHQRAQQLSDMKAAADKAVTWNVCQINNLTTQIANLTQQIKAEELGANVNDLRDRRVALVKQLSQYVEVNELDSGNPGDYQLSTKDGHLLVMNDTASTLNVSDVTTSIGAGSLRAALDTRDNYIPKYTTALDQLAYEITQQVNAIHSTAYDKNGNTGIDFFTPLTGPNGAASQISLSADVAGDVNKIAASRASTGTDGLAAIDLGNLLTAPVFSGGTVTNQYSSLVFNIGSDSSTAQAKVSEQDALVSQVENRRQSISGVSIDEETAQISQFQRAYEASAQLMQVVDELLQVTLGMVVPQ
jgi:flagellar hook-associated protein 1 FlgK